MKNSYQKFALCLLAILMLFAFQMPHQENRLLQRILGKLITYNTDLRPEKTYLQTDKDFYANGETIWFKTYLVDGIAHTKSDKSKVVYVELLDDRDSIVERRKLYINALGASGDIEIGDKMTQGDYILRSYTKYMLNDKEPVFFEKKIPIVAQRAVTNTDYNNSADPSGNNDLEPQRQNSPSSSGRPIVRFFPEGGNLVEGLGTTLGIKTTDALGNGIALRGSIKDNEGNIVSSFKSLDFGLGSVNFTPKPNKAYYASVMLDNVEEKFALPGSVSKGYVLNVKNRGDNILVQVSSNTDDGLRGTLLIGHMRGDLIFKHIGKSGNKDTYTARLLTKELFDGVAQFTLFAPDGEPVCERLVFIDNPNNDAKLSITSDSKNYGHREKVSLDLALTDAQGSPLLGNFSMSVVTQSNLLDDKSTATDIKSWLLLDSDLGGTVQNAGFFFEDGPNDKRQLLDALMLTHGWRRFVWKDLLNEKAGEKSRFPPEKGIMISGKTTALDNRYMAKKSMTTLTILGNEIVISKKPTNGQGEFSFGPFIFVDSVAAVVQAEDTLAKRKNRQKDLSIFLDPSWPKIDLKSVKRKKTGLRTGTFGQDYLKEAYRKKLADLQYGPKVTQLEEVVVKGEKRKRTRTQVMTEEMHAQMTASPFGYRVYADSSIHNAITSSAFDLLNGVHGIQIRGTYPFQIVRIGAARGRELLFLIDGMVTTQEDARNMRASEVMFIDVLRGAQAAIYGSRGGGADVVAIYTRRGTGVKIKEKRYPGIANFKIPGFYKTREFYAPEYKKPNTGKEKPDYRTTLHWMPDIKLGSNGRSSVDFYTGDGSGKYIIKVEGITDDGRPISRSFDVEVQGSD